MELFLVKPEKELAALQLIGAYLLVTNNMGEQNWSTAPYNWKFCQQGWCKVCNSICLFPKKFNFDRMFCESGDDGGEREVENREVWDCGQIGTDPS